MVGRPGGALVGVVAAVALGVGFAACSPDEGDYQEAAVEAIEGEIGDELGVDDLNAECEEPAEDAVGTTFACTADHPDGEIRITAEIADGDEVNVQTSNLLVAEDMPTLEETAASALSETTGATLPPESIDCGDQFAIISQGSELVCAFTADDGAVYDATITWSGENTSDGFDVVIADTPR